MYKCKLRVALITILLVVTQCIIGGCSRDKNQINSGGNGMDLYNLTIEEAKDINQKSNLGLEYLSLSKLSEQEAKKYSPDYPESIFTDDNEVYGYYFNYPWNSSDRRLSQIRIRGNEYDFYGIKTGDDISAVKPVLLELGYTQMENLGGYSGTSTETFIKYHVYVTFETSTDSTEITEILVSLLDLDVPEKIY